MGISVVSRICWRTHRLFFCRLIFLPFKLKMRKGITLMLYFFLRWTVGVPKWKCNYFVSGKISLKDVIININYLYHSCLGYKLFTNFWSQRNWKQWISKIITFISGLCLPISIFQNLSQSISMARDRDLEKTKFFGMERVGYVQDDPWSGVLGVILLLSILQNKEVKFG